VVAAAAVAVVVVVVFVVVCCRGAEAIYPGGVRAPQFFRVWAWRGAMDGATAHA